MGILPELLIPDADGIPQIQRFSGREKIFVHILVVVSFFTPVPTCFPLKYHRASWARALIEMWGSARDRTALGIRGAVTQFEGLGSGQGYVQVVFQQGELSGEQGKNVRR
jgi:hypothetical protein